MAYLSKTDLLINLAAIPYCAGMQEESSALSERQKLYSALSSSPLENIDGSLLSIPLSLHLAHGLAYTVGSALGSRPPSTELCLTAFVTPNKVGLTAGARAWSKHAHRSLVDDIPSQGLDPPVDDDTNETDTFKKRNKEPRPSGYWGNQPSGPVAVINENALTLFWKIMNAVTWRNLHWLPHSVLVYEVRVREGYGMRWSQNQSDAAGTGLEMPPWIFRGFVEPMMENGHEVGWRHSP